MGNQLADHAACADRGNGAGGDVAKRAFAAMMPMRKIDVAAIEGRRAWLSVRRRPIARGAPIRTIRSASAGREGLRPLADPVGGLAG
jgi:hypothetical protein